MRTTRRDHVPRKGLHRRAGVAGVLMLLLAATAPAAGDEIITVDGNSIECEVESATIEKVVYKQPNVSRSQEIAAERIAEINWTLMQRADGSLKDGHFEDAVKRGKGSKSYINGAAKGYAYYFMGLAYFAWADQDKNKLADAELAFKEYLTEFGSTDEFYKPHCQRDLAAVYVKLGKFSDAEKAFQTLGSYGPRFKMDADLGKGQMLLIQKKFDDARNIFSNIKDSSGAQPHQKQLATLGYAETQLGKGQNSGAASTVQRQLIPNAKPKLAAKGYVVWGRAELADAGDDKEKLTWAAIRFLRGAVLSGEDVNTQIAALEGARDAYKKMGRSDRVRDLEQRIAKLK